MKKNILKFCFITILIYIFSGCSWQEYFLITNETTSEITIEYKIENPVSGFQIFENKASVYQLNSSNNINWNKELPVMDQDTALLVIRVTLPQKSTLVLGHISNDSYEKHNQVFINSRVFNLINLQINNNENITIITPKSFDSFFKKKDGNIIYRIN